MEQNKNLALRVIRDVTIPFDVKKQIALLKEFIQDYGVTQDGYLFVEFRFSVDEFKLSFDWEELKRNLKRFTLTVMHAKRPISYLDFNSILDVQTDVLGYYVNCVFSVKV